MEVFNWLPLACVLNSKVLVLHGGLFSQLCLRSLVYAFCFSPDTCTHACRDSVSLDDLRNISRNREIPDSGPMCEMLWSDPSHLPGRTPSKRGVAVQFGPDVTKNFLKKNNLHIHYCHSSHLLTPFPSLSWCIWLLYPWLFLFLTASGSFTWSQRARVWSNTRWQARDNIFSPQLCSVSFLFPISASCSFIFSPQCDQVFTHPFFLLLYVSVWFSQYPCRWATKVLTSSLVLIWFQSSINSKQWYASLSIYMYIYVNACMRRLCIHDCKTKAERLETSIKSQMLCVCCFQR